MSVAPNGRIDVVWLDTRDNPDTVLSSLYYSYSIDGGVTWSPNERLTQAFDPHLGWPQQNKMGDYYTMISDNDGAHLAWAATFNGEEDVYYGHINESASTTERTFSVNANWNMVSLPMIVSDYSRTTLFPTATSNAFLYQGNSYILTDTLKPGIGFWLKFGAATSVAVTGIPITSDSVPVLTGWNLVGSLSSPLVVSSITSTPPGMVTSKFFGYNGGYKTTDTLYPGKGYWVKVDQSGVINLPSGTSASLAKNSSNARIRITPTDDLPPPPPDVDGAPLDLPKEFALGQNYPNPFNPTTTLKYALPTESRVRLSVYNLLGQLVASLVDGVVSAGYQSASWNAGKFASGIYIYRIEATSISNSSKIFTQERKMVLIK